MPKHVDGRRDQGRDRESAEIDADSERDNRYRLVRDPESGRPVDTEIALAVVPESEAVAPLRREPTASGAAPRWAVIGIFLLMVVSSIAYAQAFLMPVVLAVLLALVFSPLRRFLDRHGVPSGIAALAIVSALVAIIVGGVVTLAEPVGNIAENAPEIGRRVELKLRSLRGSASVVIEAGQQIDDLAAGGGGEEEEVPEVVLRQQGLVTSLAAMAPAMAGQTIFTLVLLLFVLASGDMLYEKIVHVMPTFKDKRRAIRLAYGVERKLSRYLATITFINACLGIAIGTAMWGIGMPNPVLFGLLGFALNFIPYIGAVCGVVIAAVVGLVTFDTVAASLIPAAAYSGLTALEGQFITPYFVGRRLELNTVVVFLSVAFWAWMWSIVGMLVAVPLLVTVRAFCEHIPQLETLGDFLSARGTEADDAEASADPT